MKVSSFSLNWVKVLVYLLVTYALVGCYFDHPSITDVRVSSQQVDFDYSEISTLVSVTGGEGDLSARIYVGKTNSFQPKDCISVNQVSFAFRGHRNNEAMVLNTDEQVPMQDSIQAVVDQFTDDLCIFKTLKRSDVQEDGDHGDD